MPVVGVPAFNAVAVLDIDAISFASSPLVLVAHAAYVNTETGNTYGETTGNQWSKTTLDKLAELRACMEADIADRVFVQPAGRPLMVSEPSGIGERAKQTAEAEQV